MDSNEERTRKIVDEADRLSIRLRVLWDDLSAADKSLTNDDAVYKALGLLESSVIALDHALRRMEAKS